MLKKIYLSRTYESESQNLLEEFYIPALSASVEYWRVSAYFSTASLFNAAQGFGTLLENGGKIKLLLGNELSQSDFDAFKDGYELRNTAQDLLQEFKAESEAISVGLFHKRMDLISKLIQQGKIEIKIAFRERGLFHKKIGILFDKNGDAISFDGSSNETASAFNSDINSEQISVFPSWDESVSEYFSSHKAQFEKYWVTNGGESRTKIYEFQEAEQLSLINIIEYSREANGFSKKDIEERKERDFFVQMHSKKPFLPQEINGTPFKIKKHQKKALQLWQEMGRGRGILALATGSGKTITSIYGAIKVYESTEELFLVIAVPYQNLADQWVETLKLFGIDALRCYKNTSKWKSKFDDAVFRYNLGIEKFFAVVVVNNSLVIEAFQRPLKEINPAKSFMFIGDECHHHSSKSRSDALPKNSNFVIGLSATPNHYLDDERNKRLGDFYGDVVAEYSLKQAIIDDVLTPYNYYVIPVALSDEETQEYVTLSNKIAQLFSGSENQSNPILTALLMKRSRLLGSAENKIAELERLLRTIKPKPYTLFYCGDGDVETANVDNTNNYEADTIRQIEAITSVASNFNYKPSRFTAQESTKQRDDILQGFKEQTIRSLVAIKCLDEGIDIPACDTAFFLASSANPRQFIQRRGRILRKSPGKKIATIYDFVVYADNEEIMGTAQNNILRNELKRVAEFSEMAENYHEVYSSLRPMLLKFGLVGLL